jgi:hypothetical protein
MTFTNSNSSTEPTTAPSTAFTDFILRQLRCAKLRAELAALRARYNSGAVAPGVYTIIRQLEVDIAWAEHQEARP